MFVFQPQQRLHLLGSDHARVTVSPLHLAVLSGRPQVLRLLMGCAAAATPGGPASGSSASAAEALGQRVEVRFRGKSDWYARDDRVGRTRVLLISVPAFLGAVATGAD